MSPRNLDSLLVDLSTTVPAFHELVLLILLPIQILLCLFPMHILRQPLHVGGGVRTAFTQGYDMVHLALVASRRPWMGTLKLAHWLEPPPVSAGPWLGRPSAERLQGHQGDLVMGVALSVESPQRHHLEISACHRAAWAAPRRAAVEMFPRVCPRARARSLARRPNTSTQT